MCEGPVSHSSHSAGEFVQDLSQDARLILDNALSYRTRKVYMNYWLHYVQYCEQYKVSVTLPVAEVNLVNFLAHLLVSKYSLSTVTSHVSAFSYLHKALGYKDFGSSFLIKQFIKGANNSVPCKPDTRLPITIELLQKIVHALRFTITLLYDRVTFEAMCILAFHGFLRIGEICCKTGNDMDNVIKKGDVKEIVHEGDKVRGLELTLQKFKHSKMPATLFLPVNDAVPAVCATRAIQRYFQHFCHTSGPLFQSIDGKPVTYSFFRTHLNDVITYLGYDTKLYKSHSFRIGAATNAAVMGYSEESIKRMGRWKSSALNNYIRVPTIALS